MINNISSSSINRQSFSPKKQTFLILLSLLVIVVTLPLILLQTKKSQDIRKSAQAPSNDAVLFPEFKQYIQGMQEGVIPPAKQILEIHLNYDIKNTLNPITLKKIKKKNGFVPTYFPQEGGFKLAILNALSEEVYGLTFRIPDELHVDDFTTENTDQIVEQEQFKKLDKTGFIITAPFIPFAKDLRIFHRDGRFLLSKTLTNISFENNLPKFQIIKGDDFIRTKKLKRKSMNEGLFLVKEAIAQQLNTPTLAPPPSITPLNSPTINPQLTPSISPPQKPTSTPTPPPDGYVDIAFIGDNYTAADMNQFHLNVEQAISQLLNIEPFKSRASQFRFSYVDNTTDLACSGFPPLCNISLAQEIVNSAGVIYDKIHIFVYSPDNIPLPGGSAYRNGIFSISNATKVDPGVWVHELGHSLGGLWDEYPHSQGGTVDNIIDVNCFRGNYIPSEWLSFTGRRDFYKGCTYYEWYRSSNSGVMASGSADANFNFISRQHLNKWIDFYAGSFTLTDSLPPTVSILSPSPNASASGTIDVIASTTDNVRTERIQLWVDGVLDYSDIGQPHFNNMFVGVREGLYSEGFHTIQLKAFDEAGNMGESEVITIYLGPTTLSPTPTTSISFRNLLANPSFERDANNDNRPDMWTINTHAIRTNTLVYDGEYSLLHQANDNSSYGISQKIANIIPGSTYRFSGWTNIPTTTDSFIYKIIVLWKDGGGQTVKKDTIKSYSQATNGWDRAYGRIISPNNAVAAVVRMVVRNLNAKIFADEFSFKLI